jgi:hypothetical protein
VLKKKQDSRAKAIVKEYANKISMDVAGKALSSVGEMVGKVFVLWGWKYLGEKVSATLEKEMSAEFRSQVPLPRVARVVLCALNHTRAFETLFSLC